MNPAADRRYAGQPEEGGVVDDAAGCLSLRFAEEAGFFFCLLIEKGFHPAYGIVFWEARTQVAAGTEQQDLE
jgi:hypothetical protein